MATFLQLCQTVARESGTVAATGAPTTVIGQTGRLLRIVEWVRGAYEDIQNARASWRWLRRDFEGTLTGGAAVYTAVSWNVTDFARWMPENECDGYSPMTIYDPSIGVSDENALKMIAYSAWKHAFARGQQDQMRPTYYAISPRDEMCFGHIPDKTYEVRGEYYRTPQILTGNADVPLMPERFHDAIVWRALMMLADFDEAPSQRVSAEMQYLKHFNALIYDQLPTVSATACGPLA